MDVWQRVPGRLKPIYHWYNVPVTTEPGDNPLDFIVQMTTVDDYVVVKLDIDNSSLETRLMHIMLGSRDVMSRVDELYFEHHIDVGPMRKYWGAVPGTSLADTYRLFAELRLRGVAAHSWV